MRHGFIALFARLIAGFLMHPLCSSDRSLASNGRYANLKVTRRSLRGDRVARPYGGFLFVAELPDPLSESSGRLTDLAGLASVLSRSMGLAPQDMSRMYSMRR